MRRLATKFLLLMGALAFLAGAPVAYAVAPPAMAGQPCPHDHEHMPGQHYWPPPVVGALITTQRVLASGLP